VRGVCGVPGKAASMGISGFQGYCPESILKQDKGLMPLFAA